MTQTVKLKRSAVAAKVPTTTDLDLGELGINTHDGKLFLKKDDGSESIVDVGANASNITAGTLAITRGGTGQTTANAALNALLPSQTSQSGKYLTTDGTNTSWAAAGGGGATLTIDNKTGAYTVVAGDLGKIINCTSGTFTVSLTAAATLGAGFNCWVWNTGTGAITIDPASTETIDGVSTLILRRGEGTQIICDGTNWATGDGKRARGYAENISNTTTRPSASGADSVAIGADSRATNVYSFALDGGVSSGFGALAFGLSASASNVYSVAGPRSTASGQGALSLGSNANNVGGVAAGDGSVALSTSRAGGTDSFAAAIANNTSSYGATGANSVAIGFQAKATGADAFAVGDTNTASAQGALAIGGASNTASSAYSTAMGRDANAALVGKCAYASGQFAAAGDAQSGEFVLRCATTDATATALTTDGAAAAATNQVVLPNNSAYAFTGAVVARQKAGDGTASAAWKIEGLIRREANAASTTLVASTVTAIDNTPGWTLALSADTTNGGLKIEATGAAATNIRWVATVQTSEVTYA